MPEDFREIAAAPTENEQIAAVRIAAEAFLHLQSQAPHPPAHVGVAGRDPDTAARRNGDQDRNAFSVAAINAGGASIPI